MAKDVVAKDWSLWRRATDGWLRSYDPLGLYGSTIPTLPGLYVDFSYSTPTGNTWTATNTASNSAAGTGTGNRTDCGLQYALDNAALNDIIDVTAGATYTGPFTLPEKTTGSGWIYIRSTGHASLPAYGQATANRVTASDATNMAKFRISAAATDNVIKVTDRSHHFRFVGIEVTVGPTTTDAVNTMVSLNNSDSSNSTVCHHIIFDRCYIHGGTSATDKGLRGVDVSGEYLGFVSCRISGFAGAGTESQSILVRWGAGPYGFVNNYLEAASECLMTGGVGLGIPNANCMDIEIRHNHFFKPLGWVGLGYNVKNLLEFKECKRVLVEGNTFENCWTDAQTGCAILVTPRDQVVGATPWTVCEDITIRLNKFINCERLIAISGRDGQSETAFDEGLKTSRVLFENNVAALAEITSESNWAIAMGSAPYGVTIRKNTIFPSAGTDSMLGYWTNTDWAGLPLLASLFVMQDNVVAYGTTGGILGDGKGTALAVLDFYFDTDYICNYNCVIGGSSGQWPVGQAGFPANTGAVGFANYAGGDYEITSGIYMTASSTGSFVGADIDAVNAAIA